MNLETKETAELVRILNGFLKETPALLRAGFKETAAQNWQVMNAIWDELDKRGN